MSNVYRSHLEAFEAYFAQRPASSLRPDVPARAAGHDAAAGAPPHHLLRHHENAVAAHAAAGRSGGSAKTRPPADPAAAAAALRPVSGYHRQLVWAQEPGSPEQHPETPGGALVAPGAQRRSVFLSKCGSELSRSQPVELIH